MESDSFFFFFFPGQLSVFIGNDGDVTTRKALKSEDSAVSNV